MLVEMTGLTEGEDGFQFPAADVHIERLATDIEEALCVVEAAKLTEGFNGRGAVRNDDGHIAEFFKRADEFLPT